MAASRPPLDREPDLQPPPSAGDAGGPRKRRAVGGFTPQKERRSRAGLIAVLGHLALGLFLLRAITFDTRFEDLFSFADGEPVQERLTYIETPPEEEEQAPPPEAPPQREQPPEPAVNRGPVLGEGGGVPAPQPVEPPRLVAPADSSAVSRLSPNEAAVVGVVPRADDRLWTMDDLASLRASVRAAALAGDASGYTGARELDSVITYTLAAAKDSLDSLAVVQALGPLTADWTRKDGNGGTWGMDSKGIRLGKVTVPSVLLGYLLGSIPALSGNPIAADRARRLSLAQSDIARFRTSGPGNSQFKMLVEELRERRDREREARRKLITTPRGGNGDPDDPPLR